MMCCFLSCCNVFVSCRCWNCCRVGVEFMCFIEIFLFYLFLDMVVSLVVVFVLGILIGVEC